MNGKSCRACGQQSQEQWDLLLGYCKACRGKCLHCGTVRDDSTGVCLYTDGPLCQPCRDKQTAQRREAFAQKQLSPSTRTDTSYTPVMICPHCGQEQESDSYDDATYGCGYCDMYFECEQHYMVFYETRILKGGN